MLSSIVRWYATRIRLHKFYGSLACNNYTLIGNQCPSTQSILQCMVLKHSMILHRNFGNTEKNEILFPPLLPGPITKIRSVWSLMSLPVTDLFLKSMGHNDFYFPAVKQAAIEAALKVSKELSNQNFNHLEDLVEQTMLKMLEIRICNLTEEQRKLIAIKEEDVVWSQVGYLKLQKITSPTEFILEMNIIITYIPTLGEVSNENISSLEAMTKLKKFVANYIFSQNYTNNGTSDWIITYVNISE